MNSMIELFFSFLQIGFFSIGGGYATIPLIQDQIIQFHQWLTLQEFVDIITVSQMTPGPLAVNASTFVGMQIAGLSGAIAATSGCILSGFFISLALFSFFRKHQNIKSISIILRGMRAASVGFIASSAGVLFFLALFDTSQMPTSMSQFNFTAFFILLASFFLLKKRKWNPIFVLVFSGIAGLFFY